MSKNLTVTLAALAGSLLLSGAASAAQVTATGGYGSGSYTTPVITGWVNNVQTSGYAGVARYSRVGPNTDPVLLTNDPAGVFYAICIEFNEFLQSGTKTWDISNLSAAPDDANNVTPAGMGAARALDMARLLNGAYPNWGSAPLDVTALQLAVWEIAIETTGLYDLTSGTIRFATTNISSASWDRAKDYLKWVKDGTYNDASMYYLALTSDGHQDFVVKTVPLPAAAWLLLSGLVGFGALGRRRKAA